MVIQNISFLKKDIASARPIHPLILGIKTSYPFPFLFFYEEYIFCIDFFKSCNCHVTDIMVFGVKMISSCFFKHFVGHIPFMF